MKKTVDKALWDNHLALARLLAATVNKQTMTKETQTLWNEHLAIERELETFVSATGQFPEHVADLLTRQRAIWQTIIVNPGQRTPPPKSAGRA